MAGKVIMPNSHGSFKGHRQCGEAAGGRSGERGYGRDSPPAVNPVGGRGPQPTRKLTVSLYVKTLLKLMSSVYACVYACLCEAQRCVRRDSWRRAAGLCSRTYGMLAYTVMLCALPAVTEGFCPRGCTCNYSVMQVSCEDAGLDNVPILLNPRVQDLRLQNNSINTLAQSLVFYLDLRFLDLSGNELESLGESNFKEQWNLEELRLGHNRLQSVEPKALRGLARLRKLALNNNAITHLEDGAFQEAGNLTELDLSHNKLRAVGAGCLRGLASLDRLDLSGNRLTRVPGGGITNLARLNLTHNLISQVPPRAFSGFPALASLLLDRNNISVIAAAAFEAVAELRRLSLADNRLLTVPSPSLASLSRLQYLDLSGNLFESLPEDCFRGLRGLQGLSVSRCPRLHAMSGDAFLSSASLRILQLSHNPRLASLPPSALASLLTLRQLDLSACGLRTLTPTQVPLRNLRSLQLAGNPLTCNCSLVWFSRLASNPNSSITFDHPTCASPPALYGVSLRDLGGDEVGCQSSVAVWAAVAGVSVLALVILSYLAVLCWRRLRRWRRNRKRREEDKAFWEDPFLPDGGLSVTRLPSRPINGNTHTLTHTPTPLGPPPRLPPTHPLNHHLHHQGCLQQCPYAALHPLYSPLLPLCHPDYDRGRPSPPTTPSSMTSPPPLPLSDPPNWYATIGGDGGEDSGRESRPPTPFDPSDSPRKVPVTYV
ncbi:carboxypeptidase N subunit 2-like [Portunus trituberculatus]|uniref:carboxypeptidase N subunit 2-like n=1 Tax=Portunus trituberculatus TaxID=210409 RepID=UPI001E1CF3BC|nr:carboxypeptidase N subunit 2-like [Portunus trituberculatus]XP_045124566.1 carboxypeptidase N subunit 2-like [Portunus trituberculatus]XP_045124567.1 carboxypeptidase N subunit 2-like [Portunus trituberculatus]